MTVVLVVLGVLGALVVLVGLCAALFGDHEEFYRQEARLRRLDPSRGQRGPADWLR